MSKKFILPFLIFLSATTSLINAGETGFEIELKPVHKDTPIFTRSKDNEYGRKHSLKMVKVANNPQISVPPDTEAFVLYYGRVKLGLPEKEYGILVDFEGKDKYLWVDSDADGDFAEESPAQIFKSDRYPQVNVYYAPTPLTFQTGFTTDNHVYHTALQFDLPYLLIARTGREDVFYLTTRTWLYGELTLEDTEVYFALVDTNDNGIYHEPDDLVFVGLDDLNFTAQKGIPIKKFKSFKLKSKSRYQIDFGGCPEKLIIKKDER